MFSIFKKKKEDDLICFYEALSISGMYLKHLNDVINELHDEKEQNIIALETYNNLSSLIHTLKNNINQLSWNAKELDVLFEKFNDQLITRKKENYE